ncbi:MAG: two-component system, sensor histidine kinase ChiS [Blastocatellia bacterium]|jgi:CheY-like chemotaxis protein|nr:two-component system, sensor histidine kinase ChiS [Blastocatellia bacterium]
MMMQTIENSLSLGMPARVRNPSRQHERFDVLIGIKLKSMSGRQDARICDISMGGCYIDSMSFATVGERLAFEVFLPTTGQLAELRGTVVHATPGFGFALCFSDLPEAGLVYIEQLILSHGGRPASRGNAPKLSNEGAATKPAGSHRILIADDDPTTRHFISALAQKEGYVVITAKDGLEAYEVLRSRVLVSIAVLDMNMPHMDGLDLVKYMKTVPELSEIPVGTVTAGGDPKLLRDSVTAGVSMFLPKPFTPDQMRFMLKALISQHGSPASDEYE